jgi:hypothetical protein
MYLAAAEAGDISTMNPKLLGAVLVAAACIAVAGVGGYVAVRQGVAPAGSQTALAETGAGGDRKAVVAETEAIVTPVKPPPETPAPGPVQPGRQKVRPVSTSSPLQAARPTAPAAVASTSAVRPPDPPAQPSAQDVPVAAAEAPRLPALQAEAPAPEPAEPPPPKPEEWVPASVPPAPVREPERQLEELIVPADAVVGVQIDRTLSSETARLEDRVGARVTRDVRVGGRVVVPAGSQVHGSVVLVDRGGKFKERARLGVRFHTVVLGDGTTIPIQTEAVYREGEAPTGRSARQIGGGAIGGAIIGAILGGGKGAVVGGATGAGAGTAAVVAQGPNPAILHAGSNVTVRLASPASITVERN